MTKKTLLTFAMFVCLSTATFAQSVYASITAHDGYWLLYSERVEQCNKDGQFLAKEVYVPDNSMDAVMFDINGQCNMVSAMNGFTQSEHKWELIDNKEIKLIDDYGSAVYFDIMEVSDNILKLRITENRDNGLKMVKISTYCFPDNRLSAEEVEQKNKRGVFEIDGFTELSDKILKNDDSPYRRLVDDKDVLSVYEPSENSATIAQLVLYDMIIFQEIGNLPFYLSNSFSLNMVGVKNIEIKYQDRVFTLFFNKKGLLTSVQELREGVEEGKEDKIVIEYDKTGKYPRFISYSWKTEKTELFMKDNWIFMNGANTMFFYEYGETPDGFGIIKSRYYDNVLAEIVRTNIYDSQTKMLNAYEYHSGLGHYDHDKYKYVYESDKNRCYIVESTDTYGTYDYYTIDKSDSLVVLKYGRMLQYFYDDPSGEKLAENKKQEQAMCNLFLDSNGNIQSLEYCKPIETENNDKSKYEMVESVSYTYQYY